jgi:hypothetical protein
MGKIYVMMFMNVTDPRFINGDYDPVAIKCLTHVLGYVWKICVRIYFGRHRQDSDPCGQK